MIGKLSFIAVIGLAAVAHAEPYSLTICGGSAQPLSGSPCFVQSAQVAPSPADLTGLSAPLLTQFLTDQGVAVSGLSYNVAGANHSGLVYGRMTGDVIVDTPFVFQAGTVLCCTADMPYALTGLNDNGLFIGLDDIGLPFVSSVIDSDKVRPDLPVGVDLDFLFASTFEAIDNANRIFGFNRDVGAFVLQPVGVPEPSSVMLVVGGLVWGSLFVRRKRSCA